MRRTVLKTLLAAPAALVLALASSVVLAQAPSKPVRLVVPAPAGDGSDVLARAIAQEMSAGLGQPVLIENRPGAGGSIAVGAIASRWRRVMIVIGSSGVWGGRGPHRLRRYGPEPARVGCGFGPYRLRRYEPAPPW